MSEFGIRMMRSPEAETPQGKGNGGTELNGTTQLYDLEFRNFDPILGRLHQIDPMADTYSSHTPYNFAFNNPANLNDVNGADPLSSSYKPILSHWSADFDENYQGADYGAARAAAKERYYDQMYGVPYVGGINETYVGHLDLNFSVGGSMSGTPMIWNPWADNPNGGTGDWIPLMSSDGQSFYNKKFGTDSRVVVGYDDPITYKRVHGSNFDIIFEFQKVKTKFGHIDITRTVIIRYEDANKNGLWDKDDKKKFIPFGSLVKYFIEDPSEDQPKPQKFIGPFELSKGYLDQLYIAVNGHLNCDCYIDMVPVHTPKLNISAPHDIDLHKRGNRSKRDPRGYEYR